MWGSAIVGVGAETMTYANGDQLDWPIGGFSPRAQSVVIYGMKASPRHAALMKKIGKAKIGGGCLYIKSPDGVDQSVLAELITTARHAKLQRYPSKAKASTEGLARSRRAASEHRGLIDEAQGVTPGVVEIERDLRPMGAARSRPSAGRRHRSGSTGRRASALAQTQRPDPARRNRRAVGLRGCCPRCRHQRWHRQTARMTPPHWK